MNRYVDPIHSYRTSAYVHGKTHVIGNTTMRRFIIKQVRYVAWRQKKNSIKQFFIYFYI